SSSSSTSSCSSVSLSSSILCLLEDYCFCSFPALFLPIDYFLLPSAFFSLLSAFFELSDSSSSSVLLELFSVPWKRISEKRTKNQAKTDKIEHEMERREKDKVKSKPKSTEVKVKVNPEKSTVKSEALTEEILNGPTTLHED
ncbi:hypothetical protein Tco_0041992, partial [Tanacetum coccineum]